MLDGLRELAEGHIIVAERQCLLAARCGGGLLGHGGQAGDFLGRLGRHALQQCTGSGPLRGQLSGFAPGFDDRLGFGIKARLFRQLRIGLVIALTGHRAIGGLQAVEVKLRLRFEVGGGKIIGQRRPPILRRRGPRQTLAIERADLIPILGLIGHGDGAIDPGERHLLARCALPRQSFPQQRTRLLGLVPPQRDVGAQHDSIDAVIAQRLGIIELGGGIVIIADHEGQIASNEAQARGFRAGHGGGLEQVGERQPLRLHIAPLNRQLIAHASRHIGFEIGGGHQRADATGRGGGVARLQGRLGIRCAGAERVRHGDGRTRDHDLLLFRRHGRRRQHARHGGQHQATGNLVQSTHDMPPPIPSIHAGERRRPHVRRRRSLCGSGGVRRQAPLVPR